MSLVEQLTIPRRLKCDKEPKVNSASFQKKSLGTPAAGDLILNNVLCFISHCTCNVISITEVEIYTVCASGFSHGFICHIIFSVIKKTLNIVLHAIVVK